MGGSPRTELEPKEAERARSNVSEGDPAILVTSFGGLAVLDGMETSVSFHSMEGDEEQTSRHSSDWCQGLDGLTPKKPSALHYCLFRALVDRLLPTMFTETAIAPLQCYLRLFSELVLYHDPVVSIHLEDFHMVSPLLSLSLQIHSVSRFLLAVRHRKSTRHRGSSPCSHATPPHCPCFLSGRDTCSVCTGLAVRILKREMQCTFSSSLPLYTTIGSFSCYHTKTIFRKHSLAWPLKRSTT